MLFVQICSRAKDTSLPPLFLIRSNVFFLSSNHAEKVATFRVTLDDIISLSMALQLSDRLQVRIAVIDTLT
jgi:hypothetical protein